MLGVSNADKSETVGGAAGGVPLTETGNFKTGTLDWALFYANNPMAIPEPGSVLLVAIANFCLVAI